MLIVTFLLFSSHLSICLPKLPNDLTNKKKRDWWFYVKKSFTIEILWRLTIIVKSFVYVEQKCSLSFCLISATTSSCSANRFTLCASLSVKHVFLGHKIKKQPYNKRSNRRRRFGTIYNPQFQKAFGRNTRVWCLPLQMICNLCKNALKTTPNFMFRCQSITSAWQSSSIRRSWLSKFYFRIFVVRLIHVFEPIFFFRRKHQPDGRWVGRLCLVLSIRVSAK